LALGAALRAAAALVGFAARQVELLELSLGGLAGGATALVDPLEDAACGIARLEVLVDVDGAGDREDTRPAFRSAGIEQPLRPVEPAAGDPRQRRHLVVAELELGGACGDGLPHGALGQPEGGIKHAAGADRHRMRYATH